MMDVILALLGTEAITYYLFNAGPLQLPRSWAISHTPWLEAGGDHLLACKTCGSFWVGIGVAFLYWYGPIWILLPLVLARGSNWLHLVFSLIADYQMDIRINRNRNKEK